MYPDSAPKTDIEAGVKVTVGDRTYTARHNSVLGREGTIAPDYFGQFHTVSRTHAKFSKAGGRWFITVPASVANSTMLDGIEVKRDEPQPLLGEHIFKMSEQCVVRIKV